MKQDPTRRDVIQSLAIGSVALASASGASLVHAAESPERAWQLPKAARDKSGTLHVSFRVIAADDFRPVPGVGVEFNWWGTDGGVRLYATDENGVIDFTERLSSDDPYFQQQVYWLILTPPQGSRFAPGSATITIRPDGTYFPDHVALPFYETDLVGMKVHAERRPDARK